MAKAEKHRVLIDDLGGAPAVAALIGTQTKNQVHNWRRRGIPRTYWRQLFDVAIERGVELPPDFVHEFKPQPTGQAA